MKIVRLESENIKGVRAVEIKPDGTLVVVGGKNGAGKSSVLDTIFYALGGKESLPQKPIRSGEKKARAFLDLGDITVERTFTDSGSKVTVKSKDGATYSSPQSMLDALCSRLSFDPLEFSRLRPKDQAEQLRELVGIDVAPLDDRRKKFYEDRTLVNRQLAAAKAKLASAVKHDDAPAEELSLADLTDELDRRQQHNEGIEAQRECVDRMQADVDDMGERIEQIDRQIAELTEERNRLSRRQADVVGEILGENDRLGKMRPLDVDEIRQQIRSAGEVNAKVAANRTYQELRESVEALEAESNDLTGDIEHIDAEKAKLLQEAPFPVPGLGIDDGCVTFHDIPLEQACSAEQLQVSVSIGMAQNKKLRIMRIKEGSLLDSSGLQAIENMAAARDYQVWVEKVADGPEGCTVYIEDGAVKAQELIEA